MCSIAPSVGAEPNRHPAREPNGRTEITIAPPAPNLDTSGGSNTDDGSRARARLLYDQGAKAYGEGRYHQAAGSFLDAMRVYPNPQLLFNIAKCYDRLGVSSSALAFYRDYLRQMPTATDSVEVTSRVHELETALAQRGLQQISISSDPPQATVAVDGTPVGVTPWTGEIWPGTHRVALTLDGRKPLSTVVSVGAIRAEDYSFVLEPLAPPKAPEPPPLPPPPPREVSALTWIALGTGTAALATTLIVEMAQKNTSGLTRTGAFFGGIGLTASTLGGVLLHFDLREPALLPTQKRALTASISGHF